MTGAGLRVAPRPAWCWSPIAQWPVRRRRGRALALARAGAGAAPGHPPPGHGRPPPWPGRASPWPGPPLPRAPSTASCAHSLAMAARCSAAARQSSAARSRASATRSRACASSSHTQAGGPAPQPAAHVPGPDQHAHRRRRLVPPVATSSRTPAALARARARSARDGSRPADRLSSAPPTSSLPNAGSMIMVRLSPHRQAPAGPLRPIPGLPAQQLLQAHTYPDHLGKSSSRTSDSKALYATGWYASMPSVMSPRGSSPSLALEAAASGWPCWPAGSGPACPWRRIRRQRSPPADAANRWKSMRRQALAVSGGRNGPGPTGAARPGR